MHDLVSSGLIHCVLYVATLLLVMMLEWTDASGGDYANQRCHRNKDMW